MGGRDDEYSDDGLFTDDEALTDDEVLSLAMGANEDFTYLVERGTFQGTEETAEFQAAIAYLLIAPDVSDMDRPLWPLRRLRRASEDYAEDLWVELHWVEAASQNLYDYVEKMRAKYGGSLVRPLP
jgi:hypothetical protein